MLSLNSPEWSDLKHAYGSAHDIPDLLRRLRDFPAHDEYTAEPYYSLWSSLCHQGAIYSASFAAVPHLVAACRDEPDTAHWSVAQLVVCIEISRLNQVSPDMFSRFEVDYLKAIKDLPNVLADMNRLNPDRETATILKAAIAVSDGNFNEAEKLLDPEST